MTGRIAAALVAGMLLAPTARADDAPDPVVAQRGALSITASQVGPLMQMAEPELRRRMEHDPAVLAQMLRERLLQLVVLKEAQDHQWDQRPDIQLRAELARQNAIAESFVASRVPPDPTFPTDEQVRAAYEANKSKLMLPPQYHLAQVFVAAPQSAGVAADADALRRVNDLRVQVLNAHADFAALARTASEDKASAPNGGDLGWLREDAVIPPMRSVVAGLAEGGVSEPVRSNDGWHVVKLIASRPSVPASLAEARDTLVRAMRQERLVQSQRAYVSGLLHDEPITVNEAEVGKLLLAR